MKPGHAAASIVATDERRHLDLLLPNLLRSACQANFDVVVLDNASNPPLPLDAFGPHVKIVRRRRRANYSANHNSAIRRTDAVWTSSVMHNAIGSKGIGKVRTGLNKGRRTVP